MNNADRIREYVNEHYLKPAREAQLTQVSVRAGDVHSAMSLRDLMPAVASALGALVFERRFSVKCLSRTGPHNGANLMFTFKLL
jgi:5-methylcytosine-specific restriction enzyme B